MILSPLPAEAGRLIAALAPAFTTPTFRHVRLLLAAAFLTTGRRTVANLVRTVGALAAAHRTTYQRVPSSASWSGLHVGCLLGHFVLHRLVPAGRVTLIGDDTVESHPGRRVYCKARHRDPVRSSHSYTAWRYGHKWVVLAVLVRLPFATRPWALPILRRPVPRRRDRPSRRPTPPDPGRLDAPAAAVGLDPRSRPAIYLRRRCRLWHARPRSLRPPAPRPAGSGQQVAPHANLFAPPPRYRGTGRPRVKGRPLPKPRAAVAQRRRFCLRTVGWYGGGTRRVHAATATGHWYKAGRGLVLLRWAFVRDDAGTHRDEYFFTTDLDLTPAEVITAYTGRWNIETTFEELRAHLRLETTRGWCPKTVVRAAPCLFGLYTVVTLLHQTLAPAKRRGAVTWPGKGETTFSDTLAAVRRWLWTEWVFHGPMGERPSQNSRRDCETSYSPRSHRLPKLHQSSLEIDELSLP